MEDCTEMQESLMASKVYNDLRFVSIFLRLEGKLRKKNLQVLRNSYLGMGT